jgi:two-component system sensor histidine kinase/response regulator
VAQLRAVDLLELCREALQAVEVKAQAAGVSSGHELQVEKLQADPDLLRRVLENLVDNAVRHTRAAGRSCDSPGQLEESVELCV